MSNTYTYIVANRASGRIFSTGEATEEPVGLGATGTPIDLEKNIWILFSKDDDYVGANSSFDEYYDSKTSQTLSKMTMNLQFNCASNDGIFILNVGESLEISQIPELDSNIKLIISDGSENEPEIVELSPSNTITISQNTACYATVEIDPPKYFKEGITIKFVS
jgi:hypothetical protein